MTPSCWLGRPTGSRRLASRRRWPTCRWARRSAHSSTRCWSTPIRLRRTSGPSCSATSPSSWSGGRSTSTPTHSPTPSSRSAPAPSDRWPTIAPCSTCPSPTACASWTSSSRWRAATCRPTDGPGAARRRRAAAPPTPAGRRPRAVLRRHPRPRPGPRRAAAARLPHRVDRRGAACRPALPHRRLQDQLARRPRRAADRPRLPPVGARRGDGALRLPAAGAALHGGAAPVPAVAAARLRPGDAPRRRPLPLPPRHVRPGHPADRRRTLRRLRVATTGRPGGGAVRPAGRLPGSSAR